MAPKRSADKFQAQMHSIKGAGNRTTSFAGIAPSQDALSLLLQTDTNLFVHYEQLMCPGIVPVTGLMIPHVSAPNWTRGANHTSVHQSADVYPFLPLVLPLALAWIYIT